MAALKKLFSPSIFSPISSSISSLWKKPKDNHDPPPTPLQQLIMGSSAGTHHKVIHGDVVVDVEAPPAPIAPTSPGPSSQPGLRHQSSQLPTSTPALPSARIPTTNIDSYSKHIRKIVPTVAIFLITFSGLLIVNRPDINLMNDSLTKSMASISDALVLFTFCFGAWLIFHCLMCGHASDHLNEIWVQKYLMLMGVVFMALSLLFRTLVTPSSTLVVLVSWMLALFIVILAFAFLRMVSYYKFNAGIEAHGPAAGDVGNLPV